MTNYIIEGNQSKMVREGLLNYVIKLSVHNNETINTKALSILVNLLSNHDNNRIQFCNLNGLSLLSKILSSSNVKSQVLALQACLFLSHSSNFFYYFIF